MELEFLLKAFSFLILILGILLYLLLTNSRKKREKIVENAPPSFESLVDKIKNRKTSNKQLLESIEDILTYYGTIHSNLDIYGLVIIRLCKHPNIDKKIILKFDRELSSKNPDYSREINTFLMQGLNSRE